MTDTIRLHDGTTLTLSDTWRLSLWGHLAAEAAAHAETRRELEEWKVRHGAWTKTFETTQLTHAKARLDAAEDKLERERYMHAETRRIAVEALEDTRAQWECVSYNRGGSYEAAVASREKRRIGAALARLKEPT